MNRPSVTIEDFTKDLEDKLAAPTNDAALFEAIVNAPFHDKLRAAVLGLGITVLLLVNKNSRLSTG